VTTARKAEGSRTYNKSAAWYLAHDRIESQRRERRAGKHDYFPRLDFNDDSCRDCGEGWGAACHRR
jgi:hypothetical protein